jgi:hypothetical protein
MTEFLIEPSGSKDFGPCECCGGRSRTVWGYVHGPSGPAAAYFVQWTVGEVDRHGAHFDLVVGNWGPDADPADRRSISLQFRRTERGPGFMIIDSTDRPAASSSLAGKGLARDEVLGTPLAQEAFAIVDAIWLGDTRIAEIVGAG